jgi:hypothetical protein
MCLHCLFQLSLWSFTFLILTCFFIIHLCYLLIYCIYNIYGWICSPNKFLLQKNFNMNTWNIITLFEVFICINPIEKRLSKHPFILAIFQKYTIERFIKFTIDHNWKLTMIMNIGSKHITRSQKKHQMLIKHLFFITI